MSDHSNEKTKPTIKVWDLPLRIFHWVLAALVCFSVLIAEFGDLDTMEWHFYSGYTVLALLLFRFAWGFTGTHYARFSQFLTSIGAALSYLRHFPSAPVTAGHNPAGGWMVLVMLFALLAQASLGLFSTDDILYEGPLAHWVSAFWQDKATYLHHLGSKLILLLVALHLLAIAAHRIVKGESLISAMWHGRKTGIGTSIQSQRLPLAGLLMAIAALAIGWLVTQL